MGSTAKPRRTRAPSNATARKTASTSAATKPRSHRQDIIHRLRRVEGQIRGVLAMIDSEAPCDSIAQQLSAARKALDRAFYEMLACSLEQELDGGGSKQTARERIAETTRLLAKYA